MRDRILSIAREFLALPTAPFREARVREYIKTFCKERGLRVREDDVGNLIVTRGRGLGTPLAFAAHMDHPGFIVEKDSKAKRTTALFYGNVEERYFLRGERVRIFTEGGDVIGRVTSTRFRVKERRQRVFLKLDGTVRRGDVGMWNLPAMRVRGDRLHTRAADDTVGCVAILAMLDLLARRKDTRKVHAVFTVAEEAGFHGAKYLCMRRSLPGNARIVAIETSKALPTARIGDGVVIRVGDKQSIFTPGMTAFMTVTATRLAKRDKTFRFQRKLMDGGTCESTIYQQFGYTNGAICVPLGNYHNRDERRGRIAAEYISVNDLASMAKLFLALARSADRLPGFLESQVPTYREERRSLGERLLI